MQRAPLGLRAGIAGTSALALAAALLGCASLGDRVGGAGPGGRPAGSIELPPPSAADGPPATLFVVSVGGLTPDRYARAHGGAGAGPGRMPTLEAMARSGVAADAVEPAAPGSSAPAHVTLVTGVPPWRHGVVSDLRLGERGVRADADWHASHVQVASLWGRVRDAGGTVAALGWPATTGAELEHLFPDVPASDGDAAWSARMREAATPGIRDRAARLGNEAGLGPGPPDPAERDTLLVRLACDLASDPQPPSLVLVHLTEAAVASVRFGPDTAEADAAFARVDAQVARLIDCARAAGRLDDTAFVVLGDVAYRPVHTRLDPNVALTEAGLITPSARGGARSWVAFARSNGSSAFVYARDEAAAVLARRALEEEGRRSRAFRVVGAEELLSLGGDREAWFGLEAAPGYFFGDGSRPPALRAARRRAAAGALTAGPGTATGFVAWGRGVRTGVRVPVLVQVDVAPTLAGLLGLSWQGTDGRVLVGALRRLPAPAAVGQGPGSRTQ